LQTAPCDFGVVVQLREFGQIVSVDGKKSCIGQLRIPAPELIRIDLQDSTSSRMPNYTHSQFDTRGQNSVDPGDLKAPSPQSCCPQSRLQQRRLVRVASESFSVPAPKVSEWEGCYAEESNLIGNRGESRWLKFIFTKARAWKAHSDALSERS
jgi:hypothetical protein